MTSSLLEGGAGCICLVDLQRARGLEHSKATGYASGDDRVEAGASARSEKVEAVDCPLTAPVAADQIVEPCRASLGRHSSALSRTA